MKIQLYSIGYTNQSTISQYIDRIASVLHKIDGDAIIVLPEYCWGKNTEKEIDAAIKDLQKELQKNQYLLCGSYPKKIDGTRYNTAVFCDRERIIAEVYKSHVLSDEMKRNKVENGINHEIIEINGLKVAIIICADIWDNLLLNRLLKEKGADLLLVPAFTVVPKNFGSYAKTQWHSLAIVRSREYLVPIVVADHMHGSKNYDVGAASCIADPSRKEKEMNGFDDFLQLPQNEIAKLEIDLEEVKAYREYRISKGLYSEKVI